MNYILSILIVLCASQSFGREFKLAKNQRSPERLRKLFYSVNKYRQDDLQKLINNFVKETRPNRYVGSAGNLKAQEFIQNYIKTQTRAKDTNMVKVKFVPDLDGAKKMFQDDLNGSRATLSAQQFKKWDRFTKERIAHIDTLKLINGYNIVWEKKGLEKPNEVIVVGAHYDTAAFDKKNLKMVHGGNQPGADNNASGVTAALALIDILSELDLKKTVRVVFFDFGEIGFLGSFDYAKNLSVEKDINVASYVELLMLGYDTQNLDKEAKTGNMKLYYSPASSRLHKQEKAMANLFNQKSAGGTFTVDFTPTQKDFQNGDNVSFQKLGIPSLVYTQNWESDFNANRIHTQSDFVASLNIKTLAHSTKSIAMAIASWALDL